MAVSLTGSRISMATVRAIAGAVLLACGVSYYAYGPMITPALHAAAASGCNELTGGSFRSYHLEWVLDARPHWSCWDMRDPAQPPTNMGWWVTPGR